MKNDCVNLKVNRRQKIKYRIFSVASGELNYGKQAFISNVDDLTFHSLTLCS